MTDTTKAVDIESDEGMALATAIGMQEASCAEQLLIELLIAVQDIRDTMHRRKL